MDKNKENSNLNNIAMEHAIQATSGLDNSRKNTLDDEQRIKILSPGMLVFKRFIRNKLAITGLIILVVMFLFSFLGPIFTPYTQTQIFTRIESVHQNYASATFNKELRATTVNKSQVPSTVNAKFVLAKNKGEDSFKVNNETYYIDKINETCFKIYKLNSIANFIGRAGKYNYPKDNPLFTNDFKLAFETAMAENSNEFEFNSKLYNISKSKIEVVIGTLEDYSIMTKSIFKSFVPEKEELVDSFEFKYAAEKAISENSNSFTYNNRNLKIEEIEDDTLLITENVKGKYENFAVMSDLIINPTDKNTFLSMEFIIAVKEVLKTSVASTGVKFNAPVTDTDGNVVDTEFKISRINANYSITTLKPTLVQDMYASPSKEHLLGTDEKGMDMMTRLMFGGRISLMVGFVVVIIEILIGVLIGGVSGYFGGAVDTLLMRFVDLFNCIPYWPIMLIVGSVMDTMEIDSTTRIFLLMFILGFMGWTGIARVVRGQILMLREQDFMIATEATGLSIKKRIFRHLVPNVMPLLIVQATMSLGGIIITEATLSFLGLGIKPPLASWGSIINAANNIHVMQNCWWVWLPTGFLIVLTVLGFNFVGDGLRDAFDPKMKR